MNICGGDIVTIIIIALTLCTAIVNGKKKETQKRSRPEVLSDEDFYTVSDMHQEEVKETVPGTKYEPVQVNKSPDVLPDVGKNSEHHRSLLIDKKKLVIYSEIMKPKFDE